METFRARSRRLALVTIFGVAVAVSKILLPSPIDKIVIVFQALFLALGSLLLGSPGATFVAAVGGFLTAFWRASLAPFTIVFALFYGVLVDGLSSAFKVKASGGNVRVGRLVVTMTVSTTIVGLSSYYVTVYILALLPRNPLLEVSILIAGGINGLVGGYLAALIWKKTLQHM